jgi:prolyl oligopeptidase PreP (S9A serine peptidase family)
MEDPEAEEVKAFVEKQVALTNSVLDKCDTLQKLKDRMTSLLDYPKYDCPDKRGGKYFYLHNKGLQPQNVLYIQVCALEFSAGSGYVVHKAISNWMCRGKLALVGTPLRPAAIQWCTYH